jgi:hypothetical protein
MSSRLLPASLLMAMAAACGMSHANAYEISPGTGGGSSTALFRRSRSETRGPSFYRTNRRRLWKKRRACSWYRS